MVCVDAEENLTTPASPSHKAPLFQPHDATPQLLHASRFISSPEPVPVRQSGDPPESTAPENCTQTESLNPELPLARRRNHRR
jgi:hypothetical protein